jgi:ribosomal protein S13
MYMREVEVLMARLRVGLEKIEENCRERVQRICSSGSGRQRQQKAENLLSEIETSIDFITHDCFAFEGKPAKDKENRQDKDNREVRELKECKEMKECRDGRKSSVAGSRTKTNERHEKSIYESVLE